MSRRWWWFAAAAVVMSGWLVMRAARPRSVATARVIRGTAIDAVYASGPVRPVDRVEIKAKVGGPVGEIYVREGQDVKKGDRLARIEAPSLGFDVERGTADLRAAQDRVREAPQVAALEHQATALNAQLDQTRAEVARAERLFASGATTQPDLDRVRTQVVTLESQLASNRAQQADVRITTRADEGRQRAGVEALRSRASDTNVVSPLDGVVLARHVETGEVVTQSQSLLRVGDLRHQWIEARVDEADIASVREKLPAAVRLYSFGGRTFKGEVVRILPEADAGRKSFEVDIDFLEPVSGLRPGMTAEVNIIIDEHKDALLVPADAVREGHVWTLSDGKLSRRAVTVGLRDLMRIEVKAGLAEGDAVVIEDEAGLREGERVVERDVASLAASTSGGAK